MTGSLASVNDCLIYSNIHKTCITNISGKNNTNPYYSIESCHIRIQNKIFIHIVCWLYYCIILAVQTSVIKVL